MLPIAMLILLQSILNAEAAVNAADALRTTPLHCVAYSGEQVEVVRLFLTNGK